MPSAVVAVAVAATLMASPQAVQGRLSYGDVPKTTDVMAPVLLRSDSTKSTHALKLFLSKYGMSGTKKVKHADKLEAKRKKKGSDSTDDEGWVSGTITTGTTCAGTVYMQGGLKLGQCIPVYSEESVYLTCSDGYVTMSKYSDEDCTTLDESVYIAEEGCGTTSSWYTDDSVSTTNSVQVTCSTSTTPPYEEDGVDYDLGEFYASSSSSTCESDDLVFYEAFPTDTCIPMSYSTYGYSSLEFEQTTAGVAYLKYYTTSKTCSGTAKTASLTTSCSSIYSGYDIYYKWATYSA